MTCDRKEREVPYSRLFFFYLQIFNSYLPTYPSMSHITLPLLNVAQTHIELKLEIFCCCISVLSSKPPPVPVIQSFEKHNTHSSVELSQILDQSECLVLPDSCIWERCIEVKCPYVCVIIILLALCAFNTGSDWLKLYRTMLENTEPIICSLASRCLYLIIFMLD